MAKILLVNPNKWGRGITAIWIASHTAAIRESGHEVKLFDATFYSQWTENEIAYNTLNQQYRPTNYESYIKWNDGDIVEDLQNMVNWFQPDVIFWSALSSHIHGEGEYVNIQYGYDLVSFLATDALLVTGGLQATSSPKSVLEIFPKTDYLIRGESDLILPALLDRIQAGQEVKDLAGLAWIQDGELFNASRQEIIRNMNDIPQYDYSLFDEQVFYRPYNGHVVKGVDYEMSRGCIYSCSYCVETVIQKYYGCMETSNRSGSLLAPGNYLRCKTALRVFRELEYLNRKLGITLFRCQDTNFLTINRKMLLELGELLEQAGLDIMLYIETRIDKMNIGDIKLLKKLRVDGVGAGVEVASEEFREGHLKRFASRSKIIDNAKKLREAGIKLTTYNIIGLPEETEAMIIDTINFNRMIAPNNITVAFFSPYTGTVQADKGAALSYYNSEACDVDGQLRSVGNPEVVDLDLLNFYKKHFSHFVRSGLSDLDQLKQKENIA